MKSLIRVVPIEHSMGPSVITLLLDDSPLPTKDSVLEVADMISYSLRRTPRRERNLCVILGCLAEKLAGPSSIAVLSDSTLSYLIGNLVSVVFVLRFFGFGIFGRKIFTTISNEISNGNFNFIMIIIFICISNRMKAFIRK